MTGDNHVAVPQNISAAVNYDCVNCLTYALATQLFVTLDGPLSDAGRQQIAALWRQIADFGTHITEVPLSEIRDRLTAFEQQILAVIEKEQGPLTPDRHGRGRRRRDPEPVGREQRRRGTERRGLARRGDPVRHRHRYDGRQHRRRGQHAGGATSGATTTGTDPSPTPTDAPSTPTTPDPSPSATPSADATP